MSSCFGFRLARCRLAPFVFDEKRFLESWSHVTQSAARGARPNDATALDTLKERLQKLEQERHKKKPKKTSAAVNRGKERAKINAESGTAIFAPRQLSPDLQAICGAERLPRSEVSPFHERNARQQEHLRKFRRFHVRRLEIQLLAY